MGESFHCGAWSPFPNNWRKCEFEMDEDMGADSHFCYLGCKNLCLPALTQPSAWEGKSWCSRVGTPFISVLNLACPHKQLHLPSTVSISKVQRSYIAQKKQHILLHRFRFALLCGGYLVMALSCHCASPDFL